MPGTETQRQTDRHFLVHHILVYFSGLLVPDKFVQKSPLLHLACPIHKLCTIVALICRKVFHIYYILLVFVTP